MTYNPLIFGRSPTERIVSCEIKDSKIELFYEDADGTVRSEFKPHKYWILSPVNHGSQFKRLNGELWYKYIKTYDTKEEWLVDKKKSYKSDLYLVNDHREAAMIIYGFTYFKGMKVGDVSVLSFDIETNGLTKDNNSHIYIISNTFRKNGVKTRKMFSCDEYESQKDMIDAWCKWVREVNPSILVGHNIYGYDIGFLKHVAELNNTTLALGRDGSDLEVNSYASQYRKDGSQSYEYYRCRVYGREIVDTMFLAFKYDFARKYPSYGLKPIIKFEKLEVEGRQFYDAGLIKDNWDDPEERSKIKAYAMFDADDSLALYELMIPSFFYFTQSVPKSFEAINYSATGSQINSFLIRSYLQNFHSIPKASEVEKYEGAISFGVPGIYKNVMKIDFSSLYPSIMRQYKVYDRFKDPEAHFLQMVEYFTVERLKNKKLAKETKDTYYKDLEQSGKVFVNSAYGLLGAGGLNFNSIKNAAFVTAKGRELLTMSVEWATNKDIQYWLNLFEEKCK